MGGTGAGDEADRMDASMAANGEVKEMEDEQRNISNS
jgi:hypothetical protein